MRIIVIIDPMVFNQTFLFVSFIEERLGTTKESLCIPMVRNLSFGIYYIVLVYA